MFSMLRYLIDFELFIYFAKQQHSMMNKRQCARNRKASEAVLTSEIINLINNDL